MNSRRQKSAPPSAFSLRENFKKWARVPAARLWPIDLLRVISSLWIIVGHSYTFAIAWLRFEPTSVTKLFSSPLEQAIPNHSFAVDTFFLLSGFLANQRSGTNKNNRLLERPQLQPQPKVRTKARTRSATRETTKRKWQEQSTTATNQQIQTINHDTDQRKWDVDESFWLSICMRYFRLAPLVLAVICASVLIFHPLSFLCFHHDQHEPKSESFLEDYKAQRALDYVRPSEFFGTWCGRHWPINALMMSNIPLTPEPCLCHTWYVSADFQLFILFQLVRSLATRAALKQPQSPHHISSPLLMISWRWLLVIMLLFQSINSLLVYQLDLPAMPFMLSRDGNPHTVASFFVTVYVQCYHWASSYFLGVALASHFDQLIHRISRCNSRRRLSLTLMNLSNACLLVHSNWLHLREGRPMSRLYASVYIFVARPLWSLNMASLLVLLTTTSVDGRRRQQNLSEAGSLGQARKGIAREPLEWRRWVTRISKLSYSAYLLHPLLMGAFYSLHPETLLFSHSLMLYLTLGHILLTYAAALSLHLLIELPIQTLVSSVRCRWTGTQASCHASLMTARQWSTQQRRPSSSCRAGSGGNKVAIKSRYINKQNNEHPAATT